MERVCDPGLEDQLMLLAKNVQFRRLMSAEWQERRDMRRRYMAEHLNSPEVQWEITNPQISLALAKPFAEIFSILFRNKGQQWGEEKASSLGKLLTHTLMQHALSFLKSSPGLEKEGKAADLKKLDELCSSLYSRIKRHAAQEQEKRSQHHSLLKGTAKVLRRPSPVALIPPPSPPEPESEEEEEERVHHIPIPTPLHIRKARILSRKRKKLTYDEPRQT